MGRHAAWNCAISMLLPLSPSPSLADLYIVMADRGNTQGQAGIVDQDVNLFESIRQLPWHLGDSCQVTQVQRDGVHRHLQSKPPQAHTHTHTHDALSSHSAVLQTHPPAGTATAVIRSVAWVRVLRVRAWLHLVQPTPHSGPITSTLNSASNSLLIAARRSDRRATKTSLQPASASRCAVASPMPLLAPAGAERGRSQDACVCLCMLLTC